MKESAYQRPRFAKLPGESFTKTIIRLLGTYSAPTCRSVASALSRSDPERVKHAVAQKRLAEVPGEERRPTVR